MTSTKTKFLILFSPALLLALAACQQPSESLGSDKEIFVFADSSQYEALYDELSRAFEPEVPTPWPEKVFELHRQPVRRLSGFTHKPRLLLAGTLDADNDASARIRSILNAQQREQVERGERYVFKTDDPWKHDQRLLVLAANDLETLQQQIAENHETLFELFNQPLNQRVMKQMFSLYEQKELAEKLLEDYGWTLRIQHDYKVYKEFPDQHFVMLRRVAPERWLFAAWRRGSPEQITQDYVVAWRNEIGANYYEGDRVVAADLASREVEFAGRRALQLTGLWENEIKTGGGPFKSWTFYDENTENIFMIDLAIFAPGQDKVPFLRQLEIMARTFRTRHDHMQSQANAD